MNFVMWAFFAGNQFGIYCDAAADADTQFIWTWSFQFMGLMSLVFTTILMTIANNPTKEQVTIAKVSCALWVTCFVNILFVQKHLGTDVGFKQEMGMGWMAICGFMCYQYHVQGQSM